MAQEQPSQSSLAFVLVKVNRRSKSVVSEARKQAVSKQEVIFRNFIQNQSICNSNHNTPMNDLHQHQKGSPQKYLSPIQMENAKYREQVYSQQMKTNESNEQIKIHSNEFSSDDLPNYGINQYNPEDTLQSTNRIQQQPQYIIQSNQTEQDNTQNRKLFIQESSKLQSPQQYKQKSQTPNNQLFENNEEIPVFLQTYMKPYKQKSLSFYKQNLQHKKQISQKSDHNRFLQIWNEDNFQIKYQHNPLSTNGQQNLELNKKAQQLQFEVPVFLPKHSKLRRSFTKLAGFQPLQKQFMGEDIQMQNSQQYQQNVGSTIEQNSNSSSKEHFELGPISQNFDKSMVNLKQQQKLQQQQILFTEAGQKVQGMREKRSASVKDTCTSQRRRTNTTNNNNLNDIQTVENSNLQKILDVYSKPKNYQKRYSHPEKFSFILSNRDNNQVTNNNCNLSLTPMRQNKSSLIGQKQTPHLAQNQFQLEDIPDASETKNKIIMQRKRHFKNLFSKLNQANQKNSLQVQSIGSNYVNTNSINSTNFTSQANNQLNLSSYQFQYTTTTTAKQTVEPSEDSYMIPYRQMENNSYFSATKATLFQNTNIERLRMNPLEPFRTNSPNRKKPEKRRLMQTFERGFTFKEYADIENENDYNLNNYINEQRHML